MHNSYIIESITTKYLNLLITFYNLLQNKKKKKKLVPQNRKINLAQWINMNLTDKLLYNCK